MSSRWTLQRRITATFGVVLAISGALISVALLNSRKLMETVNWNTHTYKVMAESQNMLTSMVNIETGLRASSPAAMSGSWSRSPRAGRNSGSTSRKRGR